MGPKLRIVAINDVYKLDNLPRLATLVKHHRGEDPVAMCIVTLAGDFVAPSVLSSLDCGRAMVECMNAVGVDYWVLGNHEDDIPTAELHHRIEELRGVGLGTNVTGFDARMPVSTVLSVQGPGTRAVRVGLVGTVMTDATIYRRRPFPGASLDAPNDAAVREAARLQRDEGCAVVVPLTHQTIADDIALALAQRTPPFPIVVGGHEHEVHMQQVEGTWIVKAGADAVHAVIADLVWPEQAPAPGGYDFPTVTVRVDDCAHYSEDEALRARVERAMARVQELESATLVSLAPGTVLSSIGTRLRQTSVGALLCGRIRAAFDADACLINGGGVRGSREYHDQFTYGDLKAEVPFDNELVVVALPGAVLEAALVQSRQNAPSASGGFLQVDDGVVVSDDNHVCSVRGGAFDPKASYRVVLVRNLLLGLDHIEPLAQFGRDHSDAIPKAGDGRDIKVVLVDAFAHELWTHLGSFASIDTDHDGIVTEKEIAAALARLRNQAASSVTTGLVLHALDANHDGAVSPDESG